MFKYIECVVLTLVVIFWVQISGQQAGHPCRTSGGVLGTCILITDCPSAMDEVRRGRFPRDNCINRGIQLIICCAGVALTKSRIEPYTPTTGATISDGYSSKTPRPHKKRPVQPRVVGETASRMCKTYAKHAYSNSYNPGLSLFSKNVRPELECPYEKEALIFGGRNASRMEFPHMTQIGYVAGSETTWACGGSLISETIVLTAAHCMVDERLGPPKLVRAGITFITDLRKEQMRNVKNLYIHPNYTLIHKYNDIGLIEVVSNFDMNTFVRPACIFTQKDFPVKNAIASGWGRVAWAGDESKFLLKVVLEMFSNSNCNKAYRRDMLEVGSILPNGILDKSMVCAGSTKELRDACEGDSGGPLQIYHEDTEDIKCMYEIIGVTSFGKSCGLAKNIPGVYTRVSAYTKWIEEIVWPH